MTLGAFSAGSAKQPNSEPCPNIVLCVIYLFSPLSVSVVYVCASIHVAMCVFVNIFFVVIVAVCFPHNPCASVNQSFIRVLLISPLGITRGNYKQFSY